MKNRTHALAALLAAALLAGPATGADSSSLSEGKPDLKSIGPIAFGPDGVLFAADTKSASIFAIVTGDTDQAAAKDVKIDKLDQKIAALLGTTVDQIAVLDLAVNPASGVPYLAVSRGLGPDATPVLLRVTKEGKLEIVSLDKIQYSKASLPDAPADKVVGEGRRKKNPRLEAITDIGFTEDKVIVAGLSNEEFASSLRAIPFPFKNVDKGTSVEIFHGAHGKLETHSPVRTFVPFTIDEEPHLLAAYTCTPLVQFPLKTLKPGTKVRGTTIAELGNRNRPLDMIVYERDGEVSLLIANNSRGVMKVPANKISGAKPVEAKVSGTEGVPYNTVEAWKGIEQLDRYSNEQAIVVQRDDATGLSLLTLPFP